MIGFYFSVGAQSFVTIFSVGLAFTLLTFTCVLISINLNAFFYVLLVSVCNLLLVNVLIIHFSSKKVKMSCFGLNIQ